MAYNEVPKLLWNKTLLYMLWLQRLFDKRIFFQTIKDTVQTLKLIPKKEKLRF